LEKVVASKKSGAGIDDVYLPSVWCFNELEFLRDHEIQISGTSTMDEDGEESFLNTTTQQSQDITLGNAVRNNIMLYIIYFIVKNVFCYFIIFIVFTSNSK